MDKKTKKLVQDILKQVAAVKSAYLIGSVAGGREREDSDLMLVIEEDKVKEFDKNIVYQYAEIDYQLAYSDLEKSWQV